MQEIRDIYNQIKGKILARLAEFKSIWKHASEDEIFAELVFCLLTPQSKAKSCWAAVERLKTVGAPHVVPLQGTNKQIEACLTGVRFHHNKARYIIEAGEKFTENGKINIKQKLLKIIFPLPRGERVRVRGISISPARKWLVENIKGLGYKEASHFLRNVGFGKEIAILDRHILKNLKKFGVIKEIPKTITAKNYFALEEKMKVFAEEINIPLDHLDFIFWYSEAGDVFK